MRLDDRRPDAAADPVDHLRHRFGDRDDVVAVDRDVVDAVPRRPTLERCGVLVGGRRELGVAVVLAPEDDRQLPHRGEVHRLVERALRDRAVAEEGNRDPAVARS